MQQVDHWLVIMKVSAMSLNKSSYIKLKSKHVLVALEALNRFT